MGKTELEGHFVLKEQSFAWKDGICVRAWRSSANGKTLLILNEIDHASTDAATFLHNYLDDPEIARIYLPNDEEVAPGEMQVVATMNGDLQELSPALLSRFPVRLNCPTPHPDAVAALPVDPPGPRRELHPGGNAGPQAAAGLR